MTWHLKDRELEKKLIEMCPNFIECIEDAIQTKEKDTNYIYVEFNREREGDTLGFNYLYFWDGELEEVPEYDPKAWNEYPKIIPPKNVVMRCEIYTERYDTDTPEPKGGKLIERTSGVFDGFKWNLHSLSLPISKNRTIRYRPWED